VLDGFLCNAGRMLLVLYGGAAPYPFTGSYARGVRFPRLYRQLRFPLRFPRLYRQLRFPLQFPRLYRQLRFPLRFPRLYRQLRFPLRFPLHWCDPLRRWKGGQMRMCRRRREEEWAGGTVRGGPWLRWDEDEDE
jgi:hypothetical protein